MGQVAADSGGAVRVPLTVALSLALLTAASYAELAPAPGAAAAPERDAGTDAPHSAV
ncbi:hypothetical protein ACF1G0_03720 [Streptomyces sp. NPDC013953]|uniref:hypothetical protein n=1 Tax=Streptomyces sp. NPDC013953 TaxID=3364868 RepID=UPI0036FC6A35